MSKGDAQIGREAVERYVVIDADGENDTNAAGYVDLVQHIREAIRADIERETLKKMSDASRQLEYIKRCEEGGPWHLPGERDIMPMFTAHTSPGHTVYLTLPTIRKMLEIMRPGQDWTTFSVSRDGPNNQGRVNDVIILDDLMRGRLTDEAASALDQVFGETGE